MSLVTQQDLDDYRSQVEGLTFIATEVDDGATSTTGTWSSSKIAAEIAAVTPPVVTYLVLNAASSGRTVVLTSGRTLTFQDSGQNSDYSNNEAYTVTFDTRGSGASCLFSSFTFEHTTSSMYDRLGIAVSGDGTSWSAPQIPWMQTSSSSMYPWGGSYGGNSWNSPGSNNGYIVPKNESRAILLGWDEGAFTLPQRYIRWGFKSDSSVTAAGWDCRITRL
jgi:hypothetical protein